MSGGEDNNAPINPTSALLAKAEIALMVLSGLSMAGIMCIIVLDVVLRYAFNAPLAWSYDMIGLYLVGAVFFFALSDTMQHHGHIALDVFVPLIPARLRHLAQAAGFGAGTVLIAAIVWLEFLQAKEAFVANDRIAAVIPFPTWVTHAVLTLGMAVLVLRCAHRAFFHLVSAIAGRDMVELPPPPVTSTSGADGGDK